MKSCCFAAKTERIESIALRNLYKNTPTFKNLASVSKNSKKLTKLCVFYMSVL